jgi:hypothetical protein
VDGPFPNSLVAKCKNWAKDNKSYNKSPDTLKVLKFAIICMEHGGDSLEDCLAELTPEQFGSVLRQIVLAVCILEKELLFEHRDLYDRIVILTWLLFRHLGNVLVKPCPIDHIEAPGYPSIKTEGIQISIIDCSISRFTSPGTHIQTI